MQVAQVHCEKQNLSTSKLLAKVLQNLVVRRITLGQAAMLIRWMHLLLG